MPDTREVLIRLDFTDSKDKYAEAWAEDGYHKRLLERRGWQAIKQQGRGVWYRAPINCISFRSTAQKPAAKPKKAIPEALRAYQEKRNLGGA